MLLLVVAVVLGVAGVSCAASLTSIPFTTLAILGVGVLAYLIHLAVAGDAWLAERARRRRRRPFLALLLLLAGCRSNCECRIAEPAEPEPAPSATIHRLACNPGCSITSAAGATVIMVEEP